MGRKIEQYQVFWVSLDPTIGSEITKKRPCAIVSPDELNINLRTVIVAPLTSALKEKYSYRVDCVLKGKSGSIALDQIRTVDKSRVGSFIGSLNISEVKKIKQIFQEMLCD